MYGTQLDRNSYHDLYLGFSTAEKKIRITHKETIS